MPGVEDSAGLAGANIFLVGARAAGKTVVGRLLAAALAYDFADTDAWLMAKEEATAAEIVARVGWPGFRELESRALLAVGSGRRRVVATGGGSVLSAGNRDFMRAGGLVFHLSAPAEILAARLTAAPESGQRPSLTGRPIAEEIAQILAEREELYRAAAHYIIDASVPPDRAAEEIRRLIARS